MLGMEVPRHGGTGDLAGAADLATWAAGWVAALRAARTGALTLLALLALPALPALLALLALLALAGCVNPAASGTGTASPILGGWTLQADPACRETLAFLAGGRFVHGVALHLPGASTERIQTGAFSGGDTTDSSGSLGAVLTTDRAAADPLLAYCGAWLGAGRVTMPVADVGSAAGFDPAALDYRPLILPGGGSAWIGSDPLAEAERFALVRVGDVLHGITFEAELLADASLFHREPTLLPQEFALDYPGVPVVNVPQRAYARSFTATMSGQHLQSLLLSVHSAVIVSFSIRAPNPGNDPACSFVLWDNAAFNGLPSSPIQTVSGSTPLELTLNPGASDPLLISPPQTSQPETVYLLPVEVLAPASGPCNLAIRARPLVAQLVADHLAQQRADRFALNLASGPAFLLGLPAGGGALRPLALQGGDVWPATEVRAELYQAASAGADPLGLVSGAPQAVRLSVQTLSGSRFLNVFPDSAPTSGLGPFALYLTPAAAAPASPPITTQVPVDPDAQAWLRITLPDAGVLTIDADTQVGAAGILLDAYGTQLRSAQSAPADASGFRMVSWLAASSYVLGLTAQGAPGDVALNLSGSSGSGVADAHLDACLMAAAAAANGAALRVADCSGQGIGSLAGIADHAELQALRLDDNSLADLAPLTGLPRLGVLSLAGLAGVDLAPLVGVNGLYRLSLARATLDAAALTVLQGLADRLTLLDLRDATGLADGDLALLAAALPNTQIVAPDGTVLH